MPFNFIPFNKGGLIGPALLGARLSPPPPSSFLPPPSMDFCVCSYLVHLVHIKSLYEVVRILNILFKEAGGFLYDSTLFTLYGL